MRSLQRFKLNRILVVRTSAIGDVVFASPIAAAIRRSHPHAHIAWLVEPGIDALIAHSANIDEIILWPQTELKSLWKSGKKLEMFRRLHILRNQLRAKHFDVVLDLQGLLKSGLLSWMTGAPQRIGLGSREGSQWLMTKVVPRGGETERISSEYLHLAKQLDLDCGDFMPELHISPEADSRALSLLAESGLAPRRYAIFAAFTTRPQKHWFPDAWQRLAPLVRQQTGLVPVLLGGPADKEAAAQIAAESSDIIDFSGRTNLAEAAALVSHAGSLIGVDTGLTHMGIAFSIPTIALFGSTCPYTVTNRTNARVIWLGMSCSPCRRKPTCGGAWTCLRDITPDMVANELKIALGKTA